MSNKKNEGTNNEVVNPTEETNVVLHEETSVVAQEEQDFEVENIEELLEKSASMDKMKTIVSLSPESITLDKVGESFRGIFVGFGEMTVNDTNEESGKRTLPCAKFLVDKKMCINGGAVLVSEIKNAKVKAGTPLEVQYVEKRGNVKIYRIQLLG